MGCHDGRFIQWNLQEQSLQVLNPSRILEMCLTDCFEVGESTDMWCRSLFSWPLEPSDCSLVWRKRMANRNEEDTEAHYWCEGNTRVKSSSTIVGMKERRIGII